MKQLLWSLLTLWLVTVLAASVARADVKLPAVFGSHMVLQRGQQIPVWGWADANETVTVTIGDQRAQTTAGADGTWQVKLSPLSVGDPRTMTVSGRNTVTFEDILVGEVWVCSGQSNMGFTVDRAFDSDLEAAAAHYPRMRLFQVPLVTAAEPQSDVNAQWRQCTPETIPGFTAVGYFFGRQLHETLQVPVGLIQTAWGGTRAEAWTSPEAMASTPELKVLLDDWAYLADNYDPDKAEADYQTALKRWQEQGRRGRRPAKRDDPNLSRDNPSRIYNAMVAPLAPYAIKGAIWYQGESNAGRAYQYRTLMPTMIQSWRDTWGQGDFPFYQVQLANFRAITETPVESDWAELREAQWLTTRKLSHVGAACITDVGAAGDIHPKDKQNVGKRLARLALHHDYDMTDITPQGPVYQSMEVRGGKAVIQFETFGSPLISYYNEPLTGFAIAGEDKNWVWGHAEIKGNTVEVSHPDVPQPVAARYNWANNPQGNLYNAGYLPAYPFRTDDWPGVTVDSVHIVNR